MRAIVAPSAFTGNIIVPASKSTMQRALALALLHTGKTNILNPGLSNDDKAAIEIIKACGARVLGGENKMSIESDGVVNPGSEIYVGESGLSVRMFAPILALSKNRVTVTGSGSLLQRPMFFFDEVLPLLGVGIKSNYGHLPVIIEGPLVPQDIAIDGSASSQYLTGLLIAFAAAADKNIKIKANNLTSKPYISLTLSMMEHFGYQVLWEDEDVFEISPGNSSAQEINYQNESDWSGAAFLLVAAAIHGSASFTGLSFNSAQADKAILQVLEETGALVERLDDILTVNSSRKLKSFEFDATHCPDLFPPLVALACYCNGKSVIRGVKRLSHKESDRGASLLDVFRKMGADIGIEDDLMNITGGALLRAASVHSHKDHRIAMAAAVAALCAAGPVIIDGAEAVNKSFPAFWNILEQGGAAVTIEN